VASLHFAVWWQYVLWNLAGFGGALIVNSFVEWGAHALIMHRPSRLIPYGYEHVTTHHTSFGGGTSYVLNREEQRKDGLAFTWKEYVIFPIFCSLIYAPLEILIGRPVFLGAILAVFAGLVTFDTIHARFHAPRGGWLERTRVFRFLNLHHRWHHARQDRNFNVSFLPIADWCFRTLISNDHANSTR
jgi:Fatty acid hydroxylase superfamily